MENQPKPTGRPRIGGWNGEKATRRVSIRMTDTEYAQFYLAGGVKWLRKTLATVPPDQDRLDLMLYGSREAVIIARAHEPAMPNPLKDQPSWIAWHAVQRGEVVNLDTLARVLKPRLWREDDI